ncbi:uncharacterized protein LOC134782806 [Penaeus indicus]|uniref:uncharacterized protein LOC134782806 n=1 Tax=Penaeus indicus TaxID=29960 RepID=UPI00300D08F2
MPPLFPPSITKTTPDAGPQVSVWEWKTTATGPSGRRPGPPISSPTPADTNVKTRKPIYRLREPHHEPSPTSGEQREMQMNKPHIHSYMCSPTSYKPPPEQHSAKSSTLRPHETTPRTTMKWSQAAPVKYIVGATTIGTHA